MANWSGLWDRQYGIPYTALGTNNTFEFNATQRMRVAKTLRMRGARPLARIMSVLTGAAAGSTATENAVRIPATLALGDPLSNGGQRTPASVALVNRATTAADVTMIQGVLAQIFGPILTSGYPTDAAGNGGGSKLGRF